MEASAAGLAAGGDGGQADGAAAATGDGQGQEQTGPNEATIAAFQDALNNGLSEQQEALREQMQEFVQQQQTPQEQEQMPAPDLGFLGDPDPAKAAQGLQEFMAGIAGAEAQRAIQAAVAPLAQQQQDMRLEQESAALMQEFPELGRPEKAQAVVDEAQRQATMIGHPELVSNTSYLRQTFLAMRAQELAQQQQVGAAGGSGVATLEGAGGASPGGAQQGAERTAESTAAKWGARTNVLSKL